MTPNLALKPIDGDIELQTHAGDHGRRIGGGGWSQDVHDALFVEIGQPGMELLAAGGVAVDGAPEVLGNEW